MTVQIDMADLLDRIRNEGSERQIETFELRDAREIGAAIAAIAERDGLPIVVSVMRGDQRAFHASFKGTTAEHDDWVRRKINTARLHEMPSLEFVVRQRVSGRTPDWLDPQEYAVAGGAVPVFVQGNLVGVVTVSGLVDSISADHDLAMAGVRSLGESA